MKIFRYLILIPQIISAFDALYGHVLELDDDPEIQALYQSLKSNPVLTAHIAVLRTHVEMLRVLIWQINRAK